MDSTYIERMSHRFSDFSMGLLFLNSNNCSRSVLAKKLAALHATSSQRLQNLLTCGFVIHSTSAISKPNIQGHQLNSQKHGRGCGLVLQPSGRQSYANCTRVAASRMQIVPAWPPVVCKFRPILFMLLATGGHWSTIYMRLVATQIQFICDWPPVACKLCMYQRPVACKATSFLIFLQASYENNYLNKKNEDTIKKSENLCDTCLSINTMHGLIQSRETVPLCP